MKNLYRLAFPLVIVLLIIYSVFVEPNLLEVTNYTIHNQDLRGLRVAFIGDFHVRPNQQKMLEKIVQAVNDQHPDIVLCTGDFVNGHKEKTSLPIEDITEVLSKIESEFGFYTVLGNHDNWYGKERIESSLESHNMTVLKNQNVKLHINNKDFYIVGVKDCVTDFPQIDEALKGTDLPIIFLTHTPDLFPQIPQKVSLILAGHTHGGQVRIPLLGPLYTASVYGKKYANGYIEENGKKMIVTKGIGTSILPVRFNCRPEIVIISFK